MLQFLNDWYQSRSSNPERKLHPAVVFLYHNEEAGPLPLVHHESTCGVSLKLPLHESIYVQLEDQYIWSQVNPVPEPAYSCACEW
jgi:hypothetical protein